MGEPETFAVRLRRLRQAAGLKQLALARRAGLTREAVSMIETGRRGRRPAALTVVRLAAALGVAPDALLG